MLNTLLSPDKLFALGAKILGVVFCILITLTLASEILSVLIEMSLFNLLFIGIFFALLSVTAYYVRAARKTKSPARQARGSERTPILPNREENE